MGRRGPLPQSSSVKLLRGNPGRRRLPKTGPPTVSLGVPDPPEFLDAVGLQEWERIAPLLAAAGLLTLLDRAALAMYCTCWGHFVAAARDIKARGMTISSVTRAGKARAHPVQNPSVAVFRQSVPQLRALLVEFGATPLSRSRLHIEQPAPLTDLETFIRRHRGEDRAPGDA
jgi:P27 family predicted phage terminase small subunit